MVNTIETVSLAGYLIVLLGIGLWASRSDVGEGSTLHFFTGGRDWGITHGSFSLFASVFSAGTFFGFAGFIYQFGIPLLMVGTFVIPIGLTLGAVLVAKPLRRLATERDIYSPMDFFEVRFQSKSVTTLGAVALLAFFTAYLVGQAITAGLLIQYITGLSYEYGIILMMAPLIIYVSLGGMTSVTLTDAFQGVLMLAQALILGFAALALVNWSFGGLFQSAQQAAPAHFSATMTLPYLSVVGMLLLNGMFFLAAPHVIMRIFAAKDDYTASQTLNGAMLLNVIGTIFLLVLVAPAVLIVTQGMELQVADRAILVFMDQALPGVFAGIVLGGFASAMMATVDAFVLGLGALVTKDIVDTWRPNTSDKKKTYIARGSIIGIGSLSMLMAFDPPQALILMNAAAASIGAAAFAFPLLLGIWWDRCNKYGAGAGILGGMIAAIFLNPVLTGMMPGWTSPLPLFQDVVVALPVSLLLTVAVSLVTPAPPREIVDDITRSRSDVIRTSADD